MPDHSEGSEQASSTKPEKGFEGAAKRRYVGELFARIAPRYDLMNTLMTGGMHHRWRRIAAETAARGMKGPALDVATGTGDLAFSLAARSGIERAIGLDLLPDMVGRARAKAQAKGYADRARFMVGDALSLPFPDATFACVTSAWGLRNMPDLMGSIQEMVRVVRPGGRVVSLESMAPERGPLRPAVRLFLHRMVPLMGQLIAGDRAAYTYLTQSMDGFYSVAALARLFEESGMENVGYLRLGLGAVAVHWGTKSMSPLANDASTQ